MPVLRGGTSAATDGLYVPGAFGADENPSALIGRCSNPACCSAWLQLFRNRRRPVFEGGWMCSPECTEARVEYAIQREFEGCVTGEQRHRHRIPLGLLMLEQGWINAQQLRRAVEAQRSEGGLRIGEWLIKQGAADEGLVMRALSLQWGCPALSVEGSALSTANELIPRLFVDAFGALPLQGPSARIFYLGFEQSVDLALAFSVEKMAGTRVECGIVQSSMYQEALARLEERRFPAVQLAEAASTRAAAHTLAKAIERTRPVRSSLVRVREWLWLRMMVKSHPASASDAECMRDVVCRIGSIGISSDQRSSR